MYVAAIASYQAELPLLGYFALLDPPGCMECESETFPSAISPDAGGRARPRSRRRSSSGPGG